MNKHVVFMPFGKRIAGLAALSLLGAGVLSARPADADEARIKKVENGLRPYGWALFGDEGHFNILCRVDFKK